MDLDLTTIQGNVVPGFNKDHQAFVLLQFGDSTLGRTWLARLQSQVATACEVQAFNTLFKSVKARRPDVSADADSGVSASWLNVALTFSGLQMLLGQRGVRGFPSVYQSNRVPGVDALSERSDVHALLILAADHRADLDVALARQLDQLNASRVDVVSVFRGDTLPGALAGHEHFGFKDGVSQPAIAGTPFGTGDAVAAGEFVLGYPDETGQKSGSELPAWAANGSFLAFLQLEQHVAAFWDAVRSATVGSEVPAERVAAAIVGRDRDGNFVSEAPPQFSHVRRAYPRWLGPEAKRHRLIRRGVPYGNPLTEGQPDDGGRGLFFLSYQADLARQFEQVWSVYLNGVDFPYPGSGRDALVGQVDDSPRPWDSSRRRTTLVSTPDGRGVSPRALPAFITPRRGGYFFVPSIAALADLSKSN